MFTFWLIRFLFTLGFVKYKVDGATDIASLFLGWPAILGDALSDHVKKKEVPEDASENTRDMNNSIKS